MSLTDSTAALIGTVSNNLRVPEFKYVEGNEGDFSELIDEFYSRYELQREDAESSLNAVRIQYFAEKQFPTRFINLLFVVDRCMDVWLRKSALDDVIQVSLAQWRVVLLKVLYQKDAELEDSLRLLTSLFDDLGSHLHGWCTNPERAKKVVPDLLESIAIELPGYISSPSLQEAIERWEKHLDESEKKVEKIKDRLIVNERVFISGRFCGAAAQHYLNALFKARSVTPTLQEFLVSTWLSVLQIALERSEEGNVPETLNLVSKKIRAVFCDKGKAAFQFGEGLIEEVQEQLSEYGVASPDAVLQALMDETISILKGQPSQEIAYKPITRFELIEVFDRDKAARFREGDWFLDQESNTRACVLKFYEEYSQVLLVNYLGMKLEIDTHQNLNSRINSRKFKKLPDPVAFSKVLQTTVSGLSKVASTQQQAREKAAAKAKQEAERLRFEQEQAAEQARIKAEEIARRTRELASKKEEAKRLESERNAVEQLTALNLGAWVSVEQQGEKKRFKLAVKFAAKKRYVFVDKYGVKKIEFDEAGLVKEMLAGQLQILNDGADFDDSLERVIGRMRMSK